MFCGIDCGCDRYGIRVTKSGARVYIGKVQTDLCLFLCQGPADENDRQ